MNDRFLVVGLGSIGRRHAANLRRLRPGARIAAFRSGEVSDKTSAADVDEHLIDWEQALAFTPTTAFICNPASHHLDAARRLLAARVPMLIEKPIADRVSGLPDFLAAIHRAGLPVAVGYNLRFSPSLRRTKELIAANAIGDVLAARAEVGHYLPDWRPQSRYQDGVSARRALGGGPLLELSHEIDYLCWLFGAPTEVSATGGRFSDLEIDVEDIVDINLVYEQPKRLLNVHLDFLQRAPNRRCRFIGTRGTIVWDAIQERIDVYRTATGVWDRVDLPAIDSNQIYMDELAAFFALIAGQPSALARPEEALAVLAIVEAASISIAKRTAQRVHAFDQHTE